MELELCLQKLTTRERRISARELKLDSRIRQLTEHENEEAVVEQIHARAEDTERLLNEERACAEDAERELNEKRARCRESENRLNAEIRERQIS